MKVCCGCIYIRKWRANAAKELRIEFRRLISSHRWFENMGVAALVGLLE